MLLRFTLFVVASVLAIAALHARAAEPSLQVDPYPDQPPSPVFCVPEIETPPALDGKLDDAVWRRASVIERLGDVNGVKAKTHTTVRLAFDDKCLYLAFDCAEPTPDRVRKKALPGEDKWPGDAVEVFVDPRRSLSTYYQFVTSINDAHNDYGSQNIAWNGKWTAKSGRSATGWVAELAIPWADFGHGRAPRGEVWGLNATRERNTDAHDGVAGESEMQTWMPMASFNTPNKFGSVFFGTPEQLAKRVTPLVLEGTLDRFVYTERFHPHALLALSSSGELTDAVLDVNVTRANDREVVYRGKAPVPSKKIGVRVPIGELGTGDYTVSAVVRAGGDRVSNRLAFDFAIKAAPPVATEGAIALRQSRAVKNRVERWHVRTGVPFPEGALWDKDKVVVELPGTGPIPVQTRVLATWSVGGSIKWLGVDAHLPLEAGHSAELVLKYGPAVQGRTAKGGVNVEDGADTLIIDTGAAKFALRKQRFNLLDQAWVGGKPVLSDAASPRGPYMVGEDGTPFWAANDDKSEVVVEEQGPLAVVVRAEGAHVDAKGNRLGRYVVRMYFYADLPYFRLQHTFIITEDTNKTRYADIGVSIPVEGEDFTFGSPDGEPVTGKLVDDQSVSLLQRRWDEFVVKKNVAGDQPAHYLAKADKAPGWIVRKGFAVIVRDFWQNFPKELEAQRQGLVVHLWPGHGERVWPLEEEVTPDVAWRLPFVHQGKLLNFKVPDAYYTGPLSKESGFVLDRGDGTYGPYYGEASKDANGMGVGKTHDMLIAFGEAAEPRRIEALRDAFQDGVHFLADPAWICETRVVGEIAPRDPEKFALIEAGLSGSFDYLTRWTLEGAQAFGMFNYGDSFHSSKDKLGQRPHYYRLWAGYHHGRARIPWLLYLRSGDPKYLDWARANTQHLLDVDTCHYATDAYNATVAVRGGHKLVGGMCDYKGYVHWHEGARVSDYNNMLDFMQLDYYLTGNGRALDVMHETGRLLIDRLRAHPSREGSGGLSSTLDYFKHTWDARALLAFTRELPRMYVQPAVKQFPPSVQWAPFLEPWVAYSGDPKARAFLLQTADDILDPEKVPGGFQHYGDGRVLAMAYELTGAKKYLLHAWGFYNKGPGLFESPGDPMHQYSDWLDYSFETQHVLPVMAHVARLPKLPGFEEVDYTNGRSIVAIWDGQPGQYLEIILPEPSDQEFWIGGRFFNRKEMNFELLDPAGRVVQQGLVPRYVDGGHRILVTRGADGTTGDYTFRLTGPDEFQFETARLSSLRTQRVAVPAKDRAPVLLTGRYFFYVAPDCEKFSVTFASLKSREARAVLAVMDPEDRLVFRTQAADAAKPVLAEVAVPPDKRGKVWCLSARGCLVQDVQGIPRWFAATAAGAKP